MRNMIRIPVTDYDKFVGQKLARERRTTLSALVESLLQREVLTTSAKRSQLTHRQKAS